PAAPDFREKYLAILLHVLNESAGGARFLVPRSPNQQLQKYRRQANPFFRQAVVHPSSVGLLRLRSVNHRLREKGIGLAPVLIPFSVKRWFTLRPSVSSDSAVMIPAASSLSRRSARIFVAIPSPDSWNSLKVRNPRIIRSRMIRSDQRSPRISSEILTGQPDR